MTLWSQNDPKQKDYECGQFETDLINKFEKFKKEIKNKKTNSIEELLGKLPEEMRSDVVFMGKSRSLQQGDRYLMKSPGSEIIASFNGHPGSIGGNSIEIMKFNGKTATFEFIDIKVENGKAIVTENPKSCTSCHGKGTRARPIFDPYRFWFNMVPSTGDTVTRGTTEEKDYLEFLEKVEKNDRFAHLKPMLEKNPIEKVRDELNKKGYYQVKSSPQLDNSTSRPSDGPGVRMFDEMYLNNHCRINRLLENEPAFETTKYAIAAAVKGCFFRPKEELSDYIPSTVRKKMNEYFEKMSIVPAKSNDPIKAVFADTEKKQKAYFRDRVGRKLWMLEERFRKEGLSEEQAYKKAKLDIEETSRIASKNTSDDSDNTISDREASVERIGPIRYLMEPLGMNTSDLSISFDPGSYTFGDFIENMGRFDPLKSLKSFDCDVLKTKSLAAFNDNTNVIREKIDFSCDQISEDDKQLADLRDISEKANKIALRKEREELRPKIEEMFDDIDCTMCHQKNSSKGAPDLPFDSARMEEFDEMMEKSAGELGDLRIRMWSRINRPSKAHGAMPPGGGLFPEEKAVLKKYLETFTGTGRADKDKLKLDENNALIDDE